jgi:hypothetical protein
MYGALAEFVRHLSIVLAQGDRETVQQVFSVVEQLLLEGNQYVREAATVGIIEDLQNSNLHSGTTPEQFVQFLLPESRKWWDKVSAFWSNGRPLRDN